MERAHKVELVDRMNAVLQATPHVFLTAFRGLTVNQASELRRKVRAAGGSYRVLKNRLARWAVRGTPAEPLAERFSGPCALAGHATDPVALARTLAEFVKNNPQLELVAGVVDARQVLDAQGVQALASLPGLGELRARLRSVLGAPAAALVRLLGAPGAGLARAIDARREQLGRGGPA
jgi:large subunit ribosomal protein L10